MSKKQKFLIKCEGKLLDIMMANNIEFKMTKKMTFNENDKKIQHFDYENYFELDQENFDKLSTILKENNENK